MEPYQTDEKRYVLGVDLGGTKILSAVVDLEGNIISRAKKKTKSEREPQEILERVVECCRKAIMQAELSENDIRAVGIGSPGPLDPFEGIVFDTPNLNLNHTHVTPYISEQLGIPCYLDNDVNVGMYGEYCYGAGQGKNNIIGLFMGTGIGGGIILDGRLYHGASLNAGELGHLKVRANGDECGCGQYGCLEAYASKTAIIRRLKRKVLKGKKTLLPKLINKDWNQLTSSVFAKAVAENDELTRKELGRASKYMGVAVGSLMNVFSPNRVIIGGGLIEAVGDYIMPIIREHAASNCFEIMLDSCDIVEASLGDDAGILGAAALAMDPQRAKEASAPEMAAMHG